VSNEQFSPIPQLALPDGDISLFFLGAQGILYKNKVEDPWFSATNISVGHGILSGGSNKVAPAYIQDEPAGVLGCFTQYQFCNPQLAEESRCEALNGSVPSYSQPVDQLWKTEYDRAFAKWAKNLLHVSLAHSPEFVYGTAGSSALLARSSLQSGMQFGELPRDQWQKEIQHIFEVTMTALQGTFVDNNNGPASAEFEPAFAKSNETAWKDQCKNQVRQRFKMG